MSFDSTLLKAALTGIAFNTKATLMLSQIEVNWLIWKTSWCQSACQTLSSWAHCKRNLRWFAVRGILCKGITAHSPWCSRRRWIDEVDMSTPVAVGKRAANCPEEAVRSLTAMRSRRRSSRVDVTFRRPLSVFRVVRYSSVHCFQTRIKVELFRCTRAAIVL